MKIEVFDLLKQTLRPEFLNRIDDVIMFNSLNKDALKQIINIEISRLVNRLKDKNYLIKFDDSVIEEIFNLNHQEEYGARPIKRIIQNLCEDFLSDEILKGNIKENINVKIVFKDNILKLSKK